jgi:hypothetical protein
VGSRAERVGRARRTASPPDAEASEHACDDKPAGCRFKPERRSRSGPAAVHAVGVEAAHGTTKRAERPFVAVRLPPSASQACA